MTLGEPRRWVGHALPRKEENRLLRGRGKFADDIKLRDMLYLRFIRSPYAHAKIVSIDVSAAEADKLLAVLDPLVALAEPDSQRLADLLATVESSNEALRQIWRHLAPATDAASVEDSPRTALPRIAVRDSYQLLVDCRDEADQQALFERLSGEGYACRVLTL